MATVCLFESGSTKTTLLIGDAQNGLQQQLALSGYNPGRHDNSLLAEIRELNLNPDSHIYFYGSGLGNKIHQQRLFQYFEKLGYTTICIKSDLQAAVMATCPTGRGIVSVLGTGGIATYAKEGEIIGRRGGYGYLIDDWGGGYELGKRIVAHWLNGDFSSVINHQIRQHLGLNEKDFTLSYYSNVDLKSIAQLSKILANFKSNNAVKKLLNGYFQFFFDENIKPLQQQYNCTALYLVGSIANGYSNTIFQIAEQEGFDVKKLIKEPASVLFDYHLELSK